MATQISIGFHASPPLSMRVTAEELAGIQNALGGGGWHTLRAEDGTIQIDLEKVIWLRVDSEEHRIGFGLSA